MTATQSFDDYKQMSNMNKLDYQMTQKFEFESQEQVDPNKFVIFSHQREDAERKMSSTLNTDMMRQQVTFEQTANSFLIWGGAPNLAKVFWKGLKAFFKHLW